MRNNSLKIHYYSALTSNIIRSSSSTKQTLSFSTLAHPDPSFSPLHQPQRHDFAKLLQLSPPDNPFMHYKKMHSKIIVSGYGFDTYVTNILISMYSKAGGLDSACKVFDEMPERNLITWSSMISMYSRRGYSEEAIRVFMEFRRSCNENPNEFILSSVLGACTQLNGVGFVGQLHCFAVKSGFDKDVYVGTCLIDFYSKNVGVEVARLVFDELVIKSAVTWTTIITGYVKSGRSDVSLKLFSQMKETGVVPDRYVLSSVLSACSVLGFLEGGKQTHGYVLRRGTEMDVSVSNVLIDLYVKCGKVRTGRKLFDQMVIKNVISWTTMISGYMQNSLDREAMKLFTEMSRLGWKPDGFACTSVLTSCGSLEALEQGRQVHAYTVKDNLDADEFVINGLIDMYSKCDSLTDARKAFSNMVNHNVISYNAMIEGYSRQENLSEALCLFHEMRVRMVHPSLLTFVSLLGISASLLALELSMQIHGLIMKYGVSLELYAGSALVDVYAKCSFVKDARLVFEEMNEKDIVVWNAMIFGYAQQSESEDALRLFLELQHTRHKPNEFTFVAVITAASNLASLPHGQQFHNLLKKAGLDFDPFVTNALVDMYAKCGSLEDARKIFNSAIWRDVVCWNSMISTYAQHGEAEEALKMFDGMIKEGIQPNYVTFVGVLSACGHVGLVEDGFRYFNSMSKFGIEPGTEHFACMVSLLGKAGKLSEAKDFIEKMPIQPAAIVWRTLLSACRITSDAELGKYAAEMAISSEPEDSGSYILLSNIFASKGMWADVKSVREKMDCNGVVKEAGCSWVEMYNKVHVFTARDKSHPESNLIYLLMDDLIYHIRGLDNVPDTATILNESSRICILILNSSGVCSFHDMQRDTGELGL